jgi:hypothetical protein
MGATEDVDRVELNEPDPIEHATKVAHIDPSRGSLVGEPLGGECVTACLVNGKATHAREKIIVPSCSE